MEELQSIHSLTNEAISYTRTLANIRYPGNKSSAARMQTREHLFIHGRDMCRRGRGGGSWGRDMTLLPSHEKQENAAWDHCRKQIPSLGELKTIERISKIMKNNEKHQNWTFSFSVQFFLRGTEVSSHVGGGRGWWSGGRDTCRAPGIWKHLPNLRLSILYKMPSQ